MFVAEILVLFDVVSSTYQICSIVVQIRSVFKALNITNFFLSFCVRASMTIGIIGLQYEALSSLLNSPVKWEAKMKIIEKKQKVLSCLLFYIITFHWYHNYYPFEIFRILNLEHPKGK